MLNKVLSFSLQNRLLIALFSVVLLTAGTYTATRMDVDVFPDLTAPTVVVLTEAHGLAPEEVERLVTFPIETSVNGATGVRRVRSSSSAGISIVWVEFDWGTDVYRARQIVTEKMGTVRTGLPEGVGDPTLAPQSSIMGEIMLIGLTADSTSLMDLRSMADRDLRPRLMSLAGVSQVVVIGGDYKQYQVLASPALMKQFDVTLTELLHATEQANRNAPGGFLNEYGQEYIVRGVGRTTDVDELASGVVKRTQRGVVRIGDVAEVRTGAAPKIGDASIRGDRAVVLTVMKQPNTNTLELTGRIDAALEGLRTTLPGDVTVDSKIFRQADFIEASIGNVQKTLIEGSLFVVVILLIFLLDLRATVISLLAIPISLVASILVLEWLGFTINTMSLGGMAIAIGSLVDDAIIDVENVIRRLRENNALPQEKRKAMLTVVYDASMEIRPSVISATLIIMAAFTPLFFLSGMEGRLLVPLGIAFLVSLLMSLVVAVTLTPVLCAWLLSSEKHLARHQKESWMVRGLSRGYSAALARALKSRKLVITGAVLLFVSAVLVFTGIGRSFLPEFNEGSLVIAAVTMPGVSLEESNVIGTNLEHAMLQVPEVRTTTRRTGRAELDEHAQGVNASEIDVPFTLGERSREEFMADVRGKLGGITASSITIGQPIGHRIDHMLSGTRANIAIKIYGPDLGRLFTYGKAIQERIKDVAGVVDLSVEQQIEIPQVRITPRREVLAQYGLTVGEVMEFVDVAFAGEKAGQVLEGQRGYDLVVRFADPYRNDIEAIRDALVDVGDGQKVPLSALAEVVSASGPNTINRENVQRKVVVSANVSGRDQKSVVEEIQAAINADVPLAEGYRVEYGGQFEAEAEASRTLLITSLIAIGVILLLLYYEFKSVGLAAIILVNLPLALIGGVFSIALTSGILSIPAIIGFITLFGVATRNGILLVSQYRHLEAEGLPLRDVLLKGSVDRLSPILMTALCSGLALVPLALGGDLPGNEIQSPMAKVILGGLLTSTLLNLFVVPVIYSIYRSRHAAGRNTATA